MQEQNKRLSLWVRYLMADSIDFFKNTNSLRNEKVAVFMNESINL